MARVGQGGLAIALKKMARGPSRLEATTQAEVWKETREQFFTRLKEQCQHTNNEYDVRGYLQGVAPKVGDLARRV